MEKQNENETKTPIIDPVAFHYANALRHLKLNKVFALVFGCKENELSKSEESELNNLSKIKKQEKWKTR